MKKKLTIFIMLSLSIFLIIGCSNNTAKESPTKVVQNFFDEVASGNFDKINKPLEEMYANSSNVNRVPNEIYENLYRSISYEVLDENIEKDTSTVSVKIKGISYNDIFSMAALSVYDGNFDEDGNKTSTTNKSASDLVIESLLTFSKTGQPSERTVIVNLKKVSNDWNLTIDKALWNEILGVSLKK